uniref:Zinc finger and BTB domain containing 16b n=2 Tax=Lepisosteidae TaxID=7915 RepID=W5M8P8_LEPOC
MAAAPVTTVRLRNPQHCSRMLRRANELRQAGTLCDAVIVVESQAFHAHSLVLACASRRLEGLLTRPGPQRCSLDFLSPRTFQQILDYAYTDTLEAPVEDLRVLLQAAQLLQMDQLWDQCHMHLQSLREADRGEAGAPREEEEEEEEKAGAGEAQEPAGAPEPSPVPGSSSPSDSPPSPKRARPERGRPAAAAPPRGSVIASTSQLAGPPRFPAAGRLPAAGEGAHPGLLQVPPALPARGPPGRHGRGRARARPQARPAGQGQLRQRRSDGLRARGRPGQKGPVQAQAWFWRGGRGLVDTPTVCNPIRPGEEWPARGRGLIPGLENRHCGRYSVGVPNILATSLATQSESLTRGAHSHPNSETLVVITAYRTLLTQTHQTKEEYGTQQEQACDTQNTEIQGSEHTLNLPSAPPVDRKHPTICKTFRCEYCGKEFLDSLRLRIHSVVHSGSGLSAWLCQMCVAVMAPSVCELLNLRRFTHRLPNPSPLCPFCRKTFDSQGALKSHLAEHTRGWNHVCQECGRPFPSHTALRRHQRSHTGELTCECDYCGRCFRDDSSLRSHKRVHTGEKPYQCESCSKRFSLKHQLDTHYRVHTGEKPFECRLCGQRSRDYSAMIKHLRTHSGAGPYQCTVCLEFCCSLSAMQKHIKTHSAQDFPPDWSINSTYLYTCHS